MYVRGCAHEHTFLNDGAGLKVLTDTFDGLSVCMLFQARDNLL
jgi:hypothetical protein